MRITIAVNQRNSTAVNKGIDNEANDVDGWADYSVFNYSNENIHYSIH